MNKKVKILRSEKCSLLCQFQIPSLIQSQTQNPNQPLKLRCLHLKLQN